MRVPYGTYDLYQKKLSIIKNKIPHSFSAYADFDFKSGMPRFRSKGFIKAFPSIIRSIRVPVPFTNSKKVDNNYRKYFFKNFFRLWSEAKLMKVFLYKLENASTIKEARNALIDWFENISLIYSERSKIPCIFDQGLLIENAEPILKILPDTKLILVIRDPVKQIANMLKNNSLKGMSWRTRFFFGVDNNDLNRILTQFAHITAYRLKLFNNRYEKIGKKKILVVDYDTFLSNFNYELERICDFVGVNIVNEKVDVENFDLEKSIDKNKSMSLDLKKYKKIINIINPSYKKVKKLRYD